MLMLVVVLNTTVVANNEILCYEKFLLLPGATAGCKPFFKLTLRCWHRSHGIMLIMMMGVLHDDGGAAVLPGCTHTNIGRFKKNEMMTESGGPCGCFEKRPLVDFVVPNIAQGLSIWLCVSMHLRSQLTLVESPDLSWCPLS